MDSKSSWHNTDKPNERIISVSVADQARNDTDPVIYRSFDASQMYESKRQTFDWFVYDNLKRVWFASAVTFV